MIPASVPDTLSTGDVCAVLGLTRDEVRHAIRSGRLEADQRWGPNTHRTYDPGDVADFACRAGITLDWTRLTR